MKSFSIFYKDVDGNEGNKCKYTTRLDTYRLSPLIEEYIDFDKLNSLGIKKAQIEFLRVNHWIRKWFDIDYSKFTIKQSGYEHLPLEEKKRIISKVKIPEMSVCEDEDKAYEYWQNNFNCNKDDCCNLRR